MPTPGTPRTSYRLHADVLSMIQDLRESKNGRLTATAVVAGAVKALHRSVYGRRSADMTPIRRTTKG